MPISFKNLILGGGAGILTIGNVPPSPTPTPLTGGQLWGWGYNYQGQLGDNTTTAKSSPTQTITGGSDWSSVSAGDGHTAAIKTDGTLWTWGNNNYYGMDAGQLGDDTIIQKSSPIQTIAFGTNWKSADCGNLHTAAIKKDGTLWTWGFNFEGQLGDYTTIHRSSPVQTILGGLDWSKVACSGNSTAAIKTDGTLWTWGNNYGGTLGDNTIILKSSPVQTIAGGTNWSFVSGGINNFAAIKTDGSLWLWGAGDTIGDNTTTNKSSPVQTIAGGTNWLQVSCGFNHTAAIKADGTLWIWGINYQGQLGDNTTISKSSPIQTIAGGTDWSKISCGKYYTAAIKTDGSLWTWGNGSDGQLGDNSGQNKSSPVQTIMGGTGWTSIAGNKSFSGSTFAIYV